MIFYYPHRNPIHKKGGIGISYLPQIPSEYDLYLFHQGNHFNIYQVFGAHRVEAEGASGVRFTLWAPNARDVRVVGNFNKWQGQAHCMKKIGQSGVWSLFIPGLKDEELYKYEIHTPRGEVYLKADPCGFFAESRPSTASKIFSLAGYPWQDGSWRQEQSACPVYERPVNIYEVHLGSWRRKNGCFLSYRELAHQLVDYALGMGYTHIELLPVMEHPYDGSWGYQTTGYFAASSRYGNPHDFMYFVDQCHQKGLGVILDWVPGHFCRDSHGLINFDGTPLYEGPDSLRADNQQWGTRNFNFSQPEVISFLISNALFWLDLYHIDGLRVDAVAFMLYLNFGRGPGQWVPNVYGGRENLEAIAFMKKLNEVVFDRFPQALMIAEESTAWPRVTGPTYLGGLGYNYKWNMGWMNDILKYMEMDPVHRKWAHQQLTFSFMYTYSENFILPLSHDEVVHGKKSLINKMPGDYWQKFANLRTLYGYMMAHPGKKLLFMGGEFGQFLEWQEYQSLDWHLLDYDLHQKLHCYVRELNHFYQREKSLWQLDHHGEGFQWIDPHNNNQSIITFMRKARDLRDFTIILCNFTPVLREGYRIGVPQGVAYREVFNSDWEIYGGSGQNNGILRAEKISWHNQPFSLEMKIPPLAVVFLKPAVR
ncbi:1,4-alpha-glucan branching protein GlgB [Desulforamulus ruminis]|uniref:1,4-alpha-glucan branching enzyme GlgB n=1 Tax=Desulforamulus ruminis (strain ATCC 23193 / DSM 2154 / NCIMB 8452 / DL) TaxID=696281 RepID=F6DPX6_DESRL|nr:1,4-alpha-glucan branching protein GlgB [Desulforamulus ruminis]AEG60815.1 1,4-alpha-glucan branching enzyme [Desulforamulus ruminis DSM 2154]